MQQKLPSDKLITLIEELNNLKNTRVPKEQQRAHELKTQSKRAQICQEIQEIPRFQLNQPNAKGERPLVAAARCSEPILADIMLLHGARIDEPNESKAQQQRNALTQAAMVNSAPCIKALLEKRANPNYIDPQGTSALHRIVFWGNVPAIKLLLEHGANPELLDIHGKTPLRVMRKEAEFESIRQSIQPVIDEYAYEKTVFTTFSALCATRNPDLPDVLVRLIGSYLCFLSAKSENVMAPDKPKQAEGESAVVHRSQQQ